MRFEAHRVTSKRFVDREIKKMIHKPFCGYFMSYKIGGL